VLHALVATVTVLIAALSKAFFEDRFLRYKRRFAALGGKSWTDRPAHKTVDKLPDARAA
jgi:hypothetical protein